MDNLIDKMAQTRTSVNCGPSNHAAYLVKSGKNRMNFHSKCYYGENHYQPGCYATTHAELDVIARVSKLHTDKIKKRNKQIYNLIVIRVSKSDWQLGNSQVCKHCIDNIILSSKRTGIKIKKIYYSDTDGNMIKTTPLRMSNDDNPFISSFYRPCGYKSLHDKFRSKMCHYIHPSSDTDSD